MLHMEQEIFIHRKTTVTITAITKNNATKSTVIFTVKIPEFMQLSFFVQPVLTHYECCLLHVEHVYPHDGQSHC